MKTTALRLSYDRTSICSSPRSWVTAISIHNFNGYLFLRRQSLISVSNFPGCLFFSFYSTFHSWIPWLSLVFLSSLPCNSTAQSSSRLWEEVEEGGEERSVANQSKFLFLYLFSFWLLFCFWCFSCELFTSHRFYLDIIASRIIHVSHSTGLMLVFASKWFIPLGDVSSVSVTRISIYINRRLL